MSRSDPDPLPDTGRLLAVDLGEVRIGLAATDPDQLVGTPQGTIDIERGADAETVADAVAARAEDLGAVGVVVGLPRNPSGREGSAARAARDVAEHLRDDHGLPAALMDERFTSVQAERAMADAGLDSRERRGRVDPVAATLILQGFLDQRRLRS